MLLTHGASGQGAGVAAVRAPVHPYVSSRCAPGGTGADQGVRRHNWHPYSSHSESGQNERTKPAAAFVVIRRYRLWVSRCRAASAGVRDCQHIRRQRHGNAIFRVTRSSSAGGGSFTSTAESGNQVRRRFAALLAAICSPTTPAALGSPWCASARLDDPSSVTPVANIWSASAPRWACLDPAIDRVERQPTLPPAPTCLAPGRRYSATAALPSRLKGDEVVDHAFLTPTRPSAADRARLPLLGGNATVA